MEKKSDLKLRLGLPGSESPERDSGLQPRLDTRGFVSGAKRDFFDAIDGSVKWGLSVNGGSELGLGEGSHLFSPKGEKSCHVSKEAAVVLMSPKVVQEKKIDAACTNQLRSAPAAKAQVVGWPPIRSSFRKNTIASSSGKKDTNDEKPGLGSLFVKVSMDGAPYLRKVDLKTYSNYMQLSSALKNMFSCFTIGQCCTQGLKGRDGVSDNNLKDLNGSEYVLTFEDKDGDWMLVGDVPWEMFIDSCKKLRIMKGSEAIGLAPRATEKCKN